MVFGISSDLPAETPPLEQAYRDFLRSREEPHIIIHAHYDGLPQIPLRDEDRIFDSQMVWSLYRVDGRNVFALKSPTFGLLPYCVGIFDGDFRRGEVYSAVRETANGLPPHLLEFPLLQLLMVCLLAQGRGLMVHACGIDDGGRGYLFAGNSTDGKTTMARLWKDHAIILNDDRIVLRQHEGRFWMYGTPWHGEYRGVSPRGLPLEQVFFLRHAKADDIHRVEGAKAASMLLTRCFPPLWDAAGMSFTLDFCAQLAADVPCHELGFVPDESVVDLVRCVR
jgi:hypothetical protein